LTFEVERLQKPGRGSAGPYRIENPGWWNKIDICLHSQRIDARALDRGWQSAAAEFPVTRS